MHFMTSAAARASSAFLDASPTCATTATTAEAKLGAVDPTGAARRGSALGSDEPVMYSALQVPCTCRAALVSACVASAYGADTAAVGAPASVLDAAATCSSAESMTAAAPPPPFMDATRLSTDDAALVARPVRSAAEASARTALSRRSVALAATMAGSSCVVGSVCNEAASRAPSTSEPKMVPMAPAADFIASGPRLAPPKARMAGESLVVAWAIAPWQSPSVLPSAGSKMPTSASMTAASSSEMPASTRWIACANSAKPGRASLTFVATPAVACRTSAAAAATSSGARADGPCVSSAGSVADSSCDTLKASVRAAASSSAADLDLPGAAPPAALRCAFKLPAPRRVPPIDSGMAPTSELTALPNCWAAAMADCCAASDAGSRAYSLVDPTIFWMAAARACAAARMFRFTLGSDTDATCFAAATSSPPATAPDLVAATTSPRRAAPPAAASARDSAALPALLAGSLMSREDAAFMADRGLSMPPPGAPAPPPWPACPFAAAATVFSATTAALAAGTMVVCAPAPPALVAPARSSAALLSVRSAPSTSLRLAEVAGFSDGRFSDSITARTASDAVANSRAPGDVVSASFSRSAIAAATARDASSRPACEDTSSADASLADRS
mmetsp:Transcript_2425/g.7728  ORF Transcript_2425/g.7728 Transcript_2425/m.7728 type:complete len:621 (+) Transcript_2425:1057-2919(+)